MPPTVPTMQPVGIILFVIVIDCPKLTIEQDG